MAVTKNRSAGLGDSTGPNVPATSDLEEGTLGSAVPPFLAAGLTLSVVLLGIVAYFGYRWLVARFQSAPPTPSKPPSSTALQPPTPLQNEASHSQAEGNSPTEEDEHSLPGSNTPSVKISHSLPDIAGAEETGATGREGARPPPPRQTTLPTVPTRHQTFQRQLSHRLDLTDVPFEVCHVPQRERLGRLRPELYQAERQGSADSGTELLQAQETGAACGRLHFTLRYDHDVEGLVVRVLQARDLPAKDFSGTSDPYVKIYLLPDRKKKFQTRVHRRNLNPVFNETFVFGVSWEQLRSRTLQFSVYDFDRFSRHDLIGQVVVRPDLCDVSHEMEYTMDVLGVPQEKVDLGELMLSLCYLPTAGRLTVTIIKARNLKVMDITGSSDPYVKVSLLCQGRRVKKKKTSVKKATLNPVYNEALVFDLPAENVEDVALVAKVVDYDRVGANEVMGCCAIGGQCIGLGRDHWIAMLDNPRKPVAQWYALQESLAVAEPARPHAHPFRCISMR